MKVNKKVYHTIVSEPLEVHELDGCVLELHSMNQNEHIYYECTNRGKFDQWTSFDGVNYRLLVEDSYYQEFKPLYSKRVNQIWVTFWDDVDKARKMIMKKFLIPVMILAVILFIAVSYIFREQPTIQLVSIGAIFILSLIGNFMLSKKADMMIAEKNREAVEKIRKIIGHKKYDEFLELKQQFPAKFYGYDEVDEEYEENMKILYGENYVSPENSKVKEIQEDSKEQLNEENGGNENE